MDNLQPKLQISQKLGVQVLPRLKVMYKYVYEMAEAFGADEYCLDTIQKGVLEEKILNKITICYLVDGDHENEMIEKGNVVISIDWEKHRLLASTDDGKEFTVDSKKSIHSQISEVTDEIIKHTLAFRKRIPIKEIRAFYQYIPEIENNQARYEQAMRKLGHVFSNTILIEELDQEFAHRIELITDKLREVSITVSTAKE